MADIEINEKPIFYATFYSILRKIAWEYGYALALHGTMQRDMDLIAVPWVEKPKDEFEMIKVMQKAITGNDIIAEVNLSKDGEKPHGRKCYIIPVGMGGYLDISITPKMENKTDYPL